MNAYGSKSEKERTETSARADPIPRHFWRLEEVALQLGISVRTLFQLRESHPLYEPDGSRTASDNPKKTHPLWSDELVRLIAFARTLTVQGTRQLTDDEAFRVRQRLGEKKRHEYLALLD